MNCRHDLTSQRAPTDESHRNPNQVAVPIQRPTFHQVGALTAKPFQHSPQRERYEQRVSIYQAGSSAEQPEIIRKMLLPCFCEVLTYGAGHKQNHDYGGCDPKWAVEVGAAFHDVEEVLTGVYGGATAVQNGTCVDIEELLVESNRPEIPFR